MLKSRIPKITREMLPAVEAAIHIGAEQVAEAARERVPVATGNLRDAIHVEHGYVIAGDNDAWYGMMVEHGTVHVPPHPFLVPALEAKRAEVVADVLAAIKRAVS